ncbi:hypothetical protein [Acinetobacter baumannii]|uniref:hypothetical protein n=1 Tax=Acinetobacter baumannii TaxID=470 RepID=UPI003891C5A1
MKPEQFIRDFGEKKAREVVEGAPEGAPHYELNVDGDFYFKYQAFEWFCLADGLMVRTYMEDHETCHLIPLSCLKRLVESVDLVESWGGIDDVKLYDLSHCKNRPESAGYKLLQAIADYESIYGAESQS